MFSLWFVFDILKTERLLITAPGHELSPLFAASHNPQRPPNQTISPC